MGGILGVKAALLSAVWESVLISGSSWMLRLEGL